MLKKRTLVKLLIGIPVVWILVMIVLGFSDTTSSYASMLKIKSLEAENSELIRAAAIKHQEEKQRKQQQGAAISGGAALLDILKGVDGADHPVEEQQKAEKQQQENAGPIQVHAPVQNDPNSPGELGKPVNIDKEKLSPEERVKYDEGWKNNAFNAYASDMISLHRSLADIRDPA